MEVSKAPDPPDKDGPPKATTEPSPPGISLSPSKSFVDSVRTGMSIDAPVFNCAGANKDDIMMTPENHINNESGKEVNEFDWQDGDIVRTVKERWPSLKVVDKVVEKLAAPWKRSLVVKLFGRFVSYPVLINRLQKLWNLSHPLQVIDLEGDFYVVSFSSDSDWAHALLDGPWMMFGTYLLVQPWSPDFDVDLVISNVTVWV